jgi:hypothetical protein
MFTPIFSDISSIYDKKYMLIMYKSRFFMW